MALYKTKFWFMASEGNRIPPGGTVELTDAQAKLPLSMRSIEPASDSVDSAPDVSESSAIEMVAEKLKSTVQAADAGQATMMATTQAADAKPADDEDAAKQSAAAKRAAIAKKQA